MTVSKDFTALLFELERARSTLDKMQILARSWRSVRRLSAGERIDLAKRVGFNGAEELLERLASKKSGLAPAMLLDAVRKARQADPTELEHLMSDLSNAERSAEAASDGLHRVADLFDLDELAESLRSEDVAQRSQSAPQPIPPPPESPTLEAVTQEEQKVRPESDPVASATPEPEEAPLIAAAAQTKPAPVQEADSQSAPAAASPPPSPATTRRRSSPTDRQVDRGQSPKQTPGGRTGEIGHRQIDGESSPRLRTRAPAAQTMVGVTSGRPISAHGLIVQLKVIRELLATTTAATFVSASEQILAIPDGWPRRRAVTAAIDLCSDAVVGELLQLVASLDAQRDRTWCLAALIRQRKLSAANLESALALIESTAARARLGALARRK
ncbi:MAG: hypothetical protein JRF63_14745 [Deltaproteobacteria bacterium]|nr:hypothetical protein [Deltaproteobacteria bacterium]